MEEIMVHNKAALTVQAVTDDGLNGDFFYAPAGKPC